MIIGIAGSFGAGKGTVVEYLADQKGYAHYSASGFITEEIVRRNIPINRDSMTEVANDLRKQFGPAFIIESLYERAQQTGGNAVIEALRAVAEVRKIKELGGVVLGVDADSKLRYERAYKRGSEKDNVSYEKFLEQEQAESNSDDPTKQNIFGALKEVDVVLYNNTTLEDLHLQIETALATLAQ